MFTDDALATDENLSNSTTGCNSVEGLVDLFEGDHAIGHDFDLFVRDSVAQLS